MRIPRKPETPHTRDKVVIDPDTGVNYYIVYKTYRALGHDWTKARLVAGAGDNRYRLVKGSRPFFRKVDALKWGHRALERQRQKVALWGKA